ncbi:hypothetical protein A3K63_00225 [Candidatus Micrarchaeota archaeon RBG_16_49_10]|nr:MAG: hypothetical protein A3K63_00225 [Candidatus Micrarchaeota archaeon RBG_16_49_10]
MPQGIVPRDQLDKKLGHTDSFVVAGRRVLARLSNEMYEDLRDGWLGWSGHWNHELKCYDHVPRANFVRHTKLLAQLKPIEFATLLDYSSGSSLPIFYLDGHGGTGRGRSWIWRTGISWEKYALPIKGILSENPSSGAILWACNKKGLRINGPACPVIYPLDEFCYGKIEENPGIMTLALPREMKPLEPGRALPVLTSYLDSLKEEEIYNFYSKFGKRGQRNLVNQHYRTLKDDIERRLN